MIPSPRILLLFPVLLLATTLATAAADGPATPATPTTQAAGGTLLLEPRHDLLAALGLRLANDAAGRDTLTLALRDQQPLRIALADGGPTALLDGRQRLPGLALQRRDGQRSPELALVPAPGRTLGLDLVDANGGTWLRIGHAMRSPGLEHGFRLHTADLRIGPALAAWSGTDGEGLLAGRVELAMPLLLPASGKAASGTETCPGAQWPTLGYTVDVRLTNIDRVTPLRCRVPGTGGGAAFRCDGPGGQEGEVVFVPDATLRNSDTDDTADVPWFRKFSGEFVPYGNDQHPFLVWNLYRLDADGGLQQIARSGLKHAFATANTGCSPEASCRFNSQVLGRACSDLYDAGSNDSNGAMAPRSELIPATGQWGRCGSIFDDTINAGEQAGTPGCDGAQDPPPASDGYALRMVALESDIDPSVHSGARWFVDAWYVVRDDVDIHNNMGWREIHPTWRDDLVPPRWTPGTTAELGPFSQGSLLEYWHAQVPETAQSVRSLVDTGDGSVLLVSRVEPRDGAYLYRYAVMNLDWTRTTTSGAEPNLRIDAQRGFDAVRLGVQGRSAASHVSAHDPARRSGHWQPRQGCGGASIIAPDGAPDLLWGELMRFDVFSPHPPVDGQVLLQAGDGSGPLAVAAPVPDAGTIFCDPFE